MLPLFSLVFVAELGVAKVICQDQEAMEWKTGWFWEKSTNNAVAHVHGRWQTIPALSV